jgi:hypothetical protein
MNENVHVNRKTKILVQRKEDVRACVRAVWRRRQDKFQEATGDNPKIQ